MQKKIQNLERARILAPWLPEPETSSGKLSREKTFANFEAIRETFLRRPHPHIIGGAKQSTAPRMFYFHQFAKVFSLESFPLYCKENSWNCRDWRRISPVTGTTSVAAILNSEALMDGHCRAIWTVLLAVDRWVDRDRYTCQFKFSLERLKLHEQWGVESPEFCKRVGSTQH